MATIGAQAKQISEALFNAGERYRKLKDKIDQLREQVAKASTQRGGVRTAMGFFPDDREVNPVAHGQVIYQQEQTLRIAEGQMPAVARELVLARIEAAQSAFHPELAEWRPENLIANVGQDVGSKLRKLLDQYSDIPGPVLTIRQLEDLLR